MLHELVKLKYYIGHCAVVSLLTTRIFCTSTFRDLFYSIPFMCLSLVHVYVGHRPPLGSWKTAGCVGSQTTTSSFWCAFVFPAHGKPNPRKYLRLLSQLSNEFFEIGISSFPSRSIRLLWNRLLSYSSGWTTPHLVGGKWFNSSQCLQYWNLRYITPWNVLEVSACTCWTLCCKHSKDGSNWRQQNCVRHIPGVISLYSDAFLWWLMELVLSGINWNICLMYLDDVIVYGGNFYHAVYRLKIVWQRTREAKYCLMHEHLPFLGYYAVRLVECCSSRISPFLPCW